MNERIRELILKAGFPTFDKMYVVSDGEELERFAQLIVRECVRYFNEDYKRDFDTLWRKDLSKGIKEHFGVKE